MVSTGYLSRSSTHAALKEMSKFHHSLVGLYKSFGIDILSNLGRRNMMLSSIQESSFARELSKVYVDVSSDGRTGEPDILIGELSRELECKLTSRQKSGSISFQTDHATLCKKKSLDYLYVVANKEFDSFAVLHFNGLTKDDYREPANGSRGKVAMIKHKAMAKCAVLFGSVEEKNSLEIIKNERLLADPTIPRWKRAKAEKSLKYWQDEPAKYTINLEDIV